MSKKITIQLLCKIRSLSGLRQLCSEATPSNMSSRYQRLAMIAANNLGGRPKNYKEALNELENQVMALEGEIIMSDDCIDCERGVIDEINFVRDIEAAEFSKRR